MEDDVVVVDDMLLLLAAMILKIFIMMDVDLRRLHPFGKYGVFYRGTMAAFFLFPFSFTLAWAFVSPQKAQSI